MSVMRLIGAFASAVLLPAVAFAQASISGVVRDTSAAVLPGVTVEAASPSLIEKVRATATDGNGQFQIIDLRPGTYTVTFTLPGFNTVKREGIELSGSFAATINVELRVGAIEETVTVSGESPVVDVQSTQRQLVLDKDVIDAIPTGRSQFNVAVLVPGVTTSGLQDVGGTRGPAALNLMAVHGGRPRDMRTTIDGLSTGSSQGGGSNSAYVVNIASTQEMAVDTAGFSAESAVGNLTTNVIPREGGNAFHGTFFGTYVNESFQGSNFTPELEARGLRTPNRLKKLHDVNPGIGGPLVSGKVWFYSSARWWRTTNYVGGMFENVNAGNPNAWRYEADTTKPAITSGYNRSVNARVTWQANQKNKFSFFYDNQTRNTQPAGSATTSPEAAAFWTGFPLGEMTTIGWTSPLTNRILVEANGRIYPETWTTSDPDYVPAALRTQIGVVDQANGITFHGPSGGVQGAYWGYESTTYTVRGSMSYVTGSHALKIGASDTWANRNEYHVDLMHPPLQYRFNNGVPNQITQNATPWNTLDNIRADLGIFAQDRWTMGRLTLNLGVRFDYFNTYFPENSLGPGPLAPNRNFTFPEEEMLNWKDVTPRSAVAYDLFGDGKTALKLTANKYLAGMALVGPLGDQANPTRRTATSATRSWTDSNGNFVPDCDLTIMTANGECGVSSNSRFGQAIATTTVDPALKTGWGKREYSWEFSAGVQRQIIPQFSAAIAYYRRIYGNFLAQENRAVRASDYTAFSIPAPSNPGLPGGGGYTVSGLYDLNPSAVGLVDNFLTSASNFGKQTEHWNGVDVNIDARLLNGFVLQGGVSTGRTSTDNCDISATRPNVTPAGQGVNPAFMSGNAQPFCAVDGSWNTQVKLLGTYTLPKVAVQVSGTLQSIPGPFLGSQYAQIWGIAAQYVATNAVVSPSLGRNLSGNAANTTVGLIAPGTVLGERLNQLDLRAAKVFRFGGARAAVNFDVYNALNSNAVLTENAAYGTFRRPTEIVQARFAKLSLQFDF